MDGAVWSATTYLAEASGWLTSLWLEGGGGPEEATLCRPPLARDDLTGQLATLHDTEAAALADLRSTLERRGIQ